MSLLVYGYWLLYKVQLAEDLDTGDVSPTARLMLHMLLSLAEWERETIRDRIRAGVDRGAAEGRTGGRPPVLPSEKVRAVRDFLENGGSVSAAARAFRVSRPTVRAVKERTPREIQRFAQDERFRAGETGARSPVRRRSAG